MLIKFEEWPLTRRSFCREFAEPEAGAFRVSERIKDPFEERNPRVSFVFDLWLIHGSLTHAVCISWNVFGFTKRDDFFFPREQNSWIPLSLLNCYSLCLSRRGMCFGKFSTPLRPSRKKDSLWVLQQNGSLASARPKPHKQRLFCLCEDEYKNFAEYPSGWLTLYDHSVLIKPQSLCIMLEIDKKKKTPSWDVIKRRVVLNTKVSVASLCPEWQQTNGEKLVHTPSVCLLCKAMIGVAEWKHLGSDF